MPKKTEPAGVGHNSGDDVLNTTAQSQLASVYDRLRRLAEEEAEIKADIKEVFAEAKGNGFDTRILRIVFKRLQRDAAKQQEEDALVALYEDAIRQQVLS